MSETTVPDLGLWLEALNHASALMELGALALCAVVAWALADLVCRAGGARSRSSIMFGKRIIDGVLFPVLLLCLALIARRVLTHWMDLAVFKVAIPILISLLVIRTGVKVLQAAFSETPMVRLLERTISWAVWLALVLWVSGLLPLVLAELDEITWTVGHSKLSVRTLIEGILTAGGVLILALWVSSAIESRLLRSATGSELSVRKAVSNATRALLMFVGLLVALSAVGIDLTALSVLGGAIGVGIGFGLQKLAANYVSGFVILAERSVRIGDSVKIDSFEGRITEINARYTVIRSLAGRESIVPNEMLITSRVENLSLADTLVFQFTLVSVAYDSDVELVAALLRQSALNHERVLRDPGPSANLIAFGADGLEFKLGYWISDPENGSDNLKSLINLDVLAALRAHHIEIPYPQRVVHMRTEQ